MRGEALLGVPLGGAGSGRVRYGVAMGLWADGQMSAETLEIYRICAARDGRDPAAMLAARGDMGVTGVDGGGVAAVRQLVAEADAYLAGLPGPGVAEVRAGIAAGRDGAVTLNLAPDLAPNAVIARWLPAALAAMDRPGLAAAIGAAAPYLTWITYDRYPAERIGAAFRGGHAYASIIGEEAPLAARDYDLGVFLIAPGVFYRDHRHKAPELYAPLTGPHGWRFRPGGSFVTKGAHEPVWNDSLRPHATLVGEVPFLCLFGWTRDVNDPAEVLDAPDWAEIEGAA